MTPKKQNFCCADSLSKLKIIPKNIDFSFDRITNKSSNTNISDRKIKQTVIKLFWLSSVGYSLNDTESGIIKTKMKKDVKC